MKTPIIFVLLIAIATTGLAQHGDERALRITPARQALNAFDERHPQVRAVMAAKGAG